MSNIDYSAVITVEMKTTQTRQAQATGIKAACRARINSVLDARTLSNLHGAVFMEELSHDQMDAFRNSQRWLRAMQTECRHAIESGAAPEWPGLPQGVAALAKAY